MIITFYGVRGSTAVPGPMTAKYGGNTSCVHIELDSGRDLILDAGTGIRLLGNKLANKSTPANILLSHGHWDHIQGYPFFARSISLIAKYTSISASKRDASC